MQTIGAIGGIGPQATMQFEAYLHREAQAIRTGQAVEAYPPLITWYHRASPMATDELGAPIEPLRPHPALLDAARWLGQVADVLVITSNGARALQPWVEEASGRPVLSMVELVVEEVVNRGWRRAGALGLFSPGVYLSALPARGIEVETIGAALQTPLDAAIFRVMAGTDGELERAAGRAALQNLRSRGVEGVILGCTEIPFLVPEEVGAADIVHPIALLARAAARRAMG